MPQNPPPSPPSGLNEQFHLTLSKDELNGLVAAVNLGYFILQRKKYFIMLSTRGILLSDQALLDMIGSAYSITLGHAKREDFEEIEEAEFTAQLDARMHDLRRVAAIISRMYATTVDIDAAEISKLDAIISHD